MKYLWDTNILLNRIRKSSHYYKWNDKFHFKENGNEVLLSVINLGEIESIALQRSWGVERMLFLKQILKEVQIINLNDEVIQTYAQIDAFSQNKLPELPLNNSARNMGKNDIWLAATAHVHNLKFVTTDKDFDHLKGVFIDLLKVEVGKFDLS